MKKYVMNLVWCLNSKTIYDYNKNLDFLNSITIPKRNFFRSGDLKFEWTKTTIEHYTEKKKNIKIILQPDAIESVQKKISKKTDYLNLSFMELQLLDLGFLNIILICDFKKGFKQKKYDEEGMKLSEAISELQPDFDGIIEILSRCQIIKKSDFYHFGSPQIIREKKLHSPDKSYLFNQHVFFIKENRKATSFIQNLKKEGDHFYYKSILLTNVWGHCFWKVDHSLTTQEIIDLMAIDSFCLAESVTYDNSISCYNAFLEVSGEKDKINSQDLRRIFIYNNLLVQKIKLWKRNLTLEQIKFVKHYYGQTDLDRKFDIFKNAEESLRFAIEGIEAGYTQKSNRIIQFILSIFTALTIYSVVNDVFSIVNEKTGSINNLNIFSSNSYLLFSITVIIIVILIIFKNLTKKL